MIVQVKKIFASLLIGLSISIFYWVGSFIASQSPMVLRSISLHPIFLKVYGSLGIVIGILFYFIIRKSKRTFLLIGILSFLIAVIVWWLVGLPFVQHLILPPTTIK